MALSAQLYQRLRNTWMRCGEFDSDATLRAVFITDELAPFRGGFRETDSAASRVDACLLYLLDKRLPDGRPALSVFLAALRDRYMPGDALRDELGALAGEVETALGMPAASPLPAAPAAPPAVAPEANIFARYEAGVRELLHRLGSGHQRYSEALVYQQRLAENIAKTCYGDNDTLQSARAEVLARLNGLAQAALGMTFNELCGVGVAPAGGATSPAATATPPAGSGKYNVQIGQATGVVIGDNAQVTQHIAGAAGAPAAGGGRPVLQPTPDLAALRGRLNEAFDDAGLNAFCLDNFTEVYDKFCQGMRKDEKITMLLDYCRREPARMEKLEALLPD